MFGVFFEQVQQYVEATINEIINGHRGTRRDYVFWGGKLVVMLMFADDVVLMARTEEGMKRIMGGVQAFCDDKGLVINYKKGKTEIMS